MNIQREGNHGNSVAVASEPMDLPGWDGSLPGGPSPHPQGGSHPRAGKAGWHGIRGVRPPSLQAGAPGWGLVAPEDSPGTPRVPRWNSTPA